MPEYIHNAYYPIVLEEAKSLPLYIAVVGVVKKEKGILRPDGIEHHQLLFTKRGEGFAHIGKNTHIVKKDTVFYLPKGTAHQYYGNVNPWTTYCITFGGGTTSDLLGKEPFIASLERFEYYEKQIRHMIGLERNADWPYQTSVLLYELLLSLRRDMKAGRRSNGKWDDVMNYLMEHYHRPISLEELAACCKMSPQSFCRAFKKRYGVRPFEYLTLLRIQKAKELFMREKELSVKEISRMVGYHDPSYFGMLFKKYEHMTPQTFRDFN